MFTFEFKESEFLISPERLVGMLGERMDALWKAQPNAKNAEWTRQVKQFLEEIAKTVEDKARKLTVEVLYTNTAADKHEFLLDLVWWCRIGQESPHKEFAALAVEIEWASFWWGLPGESLGHHIRNRVGEDFGKLTVIKSPMKLMIFCTEYDKAERSHVPMQRIVLEEIDRYLTCYSHHISGEIYILMDVASNGHRQSWTRKVDRTGTLGPLETIAEIRL